VADEVICGFGRTGAWWGSQTYDIQPDILAMAKGLSSGYLPIAAVAFGQRVGDAIFNSDKEYAHGVTYAGHPAAAAVSLENIKIIEEEGLATRAAGPIGAYWREALTEAFKNHPMVGEVRTKGLLACMELAEDRSKKKRFDDKREVGMTCRNISVNNGLVMRAIRDGMVLSPPLIVTEAQIDEIVTKAKKSIDETMAAVGFKG
jgi:putrescine aminotransferase